MSETKNYPEPVEKAFEKFMDIQGVKNLMAASDLPVNLFIKTTKTAFFAGYVAGMGK